MEDPQLNTADIGQEESSAVNIDNVENEVTKVFKSLQDSRQFLQKLCEKLNIKFKPNQEKNIRGQILRKLDEYTKPRMLEGTLVEKLEKILGEREVQAAPAVAIEEVKQEERVDSEEVRKLTEENERLKQVEQDNEKLKQEINDLKQLLEVFVNETGDLVAKNPQNFSPEFLHNMMKSLPGEEQARSVVQKFTIDQVNKKLIVEYDLQLLKLETEALANQPPLENAIQEFIKVFAKTFQELFEMHYELLKNVTTINNYLHEEGNSQEEEIEKITNELQAGRDRLDSFFTELSKQTTYKDLISGIIENYDTQVPNWKSLYKPMFDKNESLLNKTKRMLTDYEEKIKKYLEI